MHSSGIPRQGLRHMLILYPADLQQSADFIDITPAGHGRPRLFPVCCNGTQNFFFFFLLHLLFLSLSEAIKAWTVLFFFFFSPCFDVIRRNPTGWKWSVAQRCLEGVNDISLEIFQCSCIQGGWVFSPFAPTIHSSSSESEGKMFIDLLILQIQYVSFLIKYKVITCIKMSLASHLLSPPRGFF